MSTYWFHVWSHGVSGSTQTSLVFLGSARDLLLILAHTLTTTLEEIHSLTSIKMMSLACRYRSYTSATNCFRINAKNIKHLKSFTGASQERYMVQGKKIGLGGFFLLLIPATTFCLGTWQVRRRKWKLNLIDFLQSKIKQPPIPFPNNSDELLKLEYQKVKISGFFDHDKELYLGPRSLLSEGESITTGGGLFSSGQSGYNVITPFTLADTKLRILVNRGWVPRKNKDPSTRPQGQVTAPVELTGVIRLQEARPPFMPENAKNSRLFLYRDVTQMADITDTAPIYLDIVETLDGGPQGSQTLVSIRNEHMSYIITWYSLSAITSFLWFRRFIVGKPLM